MGEQPHPEQSRSERKPQTVKVQWREHDDSFRIAIDRYRLNMLQRAIQHSPYDEVKGMRAEMIRALLNQPEQR